MKDMSVSEKPYRRKISLGESNNALISLIAVCLVLTVGLAFMKAVWYYSYPKEVALSYYNSNVLSWFVLPASWHGLLQKPWTLVTHMFVHDDFWKILANMLWLWCFGFIMQDLTGNRKIIPVFIYGALAGALGFILAYQIIPELKPLAGTASTTGASAGIMAVAVATTLVASGYRVFPNIAGGIPVWVLTLVYAVSDLATVSLSDTGNLVAHLAGALAGFLFIVMLRRGYDGSEWMNNLAGWFSNLFNPDKPRKGEQPVKEQLFYRTQNRLPYKKTANITQDRIDEILDKINQKGYHFLTDEEKELLRRASREDI